MIRSLFGMLTALLLVAFAPAQNLEPYKQKLGQPIVSQQLVGTALANLYQNGSVVLVDFASDGNLTLSFINDQLPPGDVQVLTTRWTDAQGVTHTVSTPIIGQTPAALAKAREQHESAVKWMQGLYPPRPV